MRARRAVAVATALAGLVGLGTAGAVAAAQKAPSKAALARVVVGDDGWLFSSQDWKVPCQDIGAPTAATARAVVDAADAIAASGREAVVLFGPDKASVMLDALPPVVPDAFCHARQDRTLWERVRSSEHFLDLRGPLRTASRSAQVYYKKDTHFAHAGDAVYARELAERLDPTLDLGFRTATTTGQVRGDLASVLGRPAHERVVSRASLANRVEVVELPERAIGLTVPVREFRATPLLGGRVLPGRTVLVGDSFTAVALHQLAQLSEETVFVWTDSRAPLQPMLDEIVQADRVVVESVERLTTRFRMWRPDVVEGLRSLPRRDPLLDPVTGRLPG